MIKCISCSAAIPPEWKSAISSNICPGCGGNIADENFVSLHREIREAMEKMANDPVGLAGWLLSNYEMRKFGSAEPTHFHTKQEHATKAILNIREEGSSIVPEKTNIFNQRAGMDRFKNLAAQIKNKNTGAADPEEFAGEEFDDVEPINNREESEMADLFEQQLAPPTIVNKQEYKTAFLREQMGGGSVGKIKRS